jgi:hypothetical protein
MYRAFLAVLLLWEVISPQTGGEERKREREREREGERESTLYG